MKKYAKVLLTVSLVIALILILNYFVTADITRTKYEIADIYEGTEMDYGTLAITIYGNITQIKTVLQKSQINNGTYEVQVTKIAENLYKIEDTRMYIKTKYCYKYANSRNVIIKIISNYGYKKGDIIF